VRRRLASGIIGSLLLGGVLFAVAAEEDSGSAPDAPQPEAAAPSGGWSRDEVRIYSRSSEEVFRAARRALVHLKLAEEKSDEKTGIIRTRSQRLHSRPGSALPDPGLSRDLIARTAALYLFVPRCCEPGRVYVHATIEGIKGGAGVTFMTYGSQPIQKALLDQIDVLLEEPGHVLPATRRERDLLAERLLGRELTCPGARVDLPELEPQSVRPEEELPVLLDKVQPFYPDTLRAQRKEGKVILETHMQEDGVIYRIVSKGKQPDSMFVNIAANTVALWRYRPPMVDGCNRGVTFQVVVDYFLK